MTEDLTLEAAKMAHVKKVLEMELGVQAVVSKRLGISPRSLRDYIRRMKDIDKDIAFESGKAKNLFPTNEERLDHLDRRIKHERRKK